MAYTLDNLRTDIRNYTEVDDSVLSNTVLDTIIKNTENKIYREADSDDNRFYATSNLQSGNRYVTIPSDLRFIRYVQLKDGSGNQVFLEKKDTSYMAAYYDTLSDYEIIWDNRLADNGFQSGTRPIWEGEQERIEAWAADPGSLGYSFVNERCCGRDYAVTYMTSLISNLGGSITFNSQIVCKMRSRPPYPPQRVHLAVGIELISFRSPYS